MDIDRIRVEKKAKELLLEVDKARVRLSRIGDAARERADNHLNAGNLEEAENWSIQSNQFSTESRAYLKMSAIIAKTFWDCPDSPDSIRSLVKALKGE